MFAPAPDLLILCNVQAIDRSHAADQPVDAVIERGVLTRIGPGAAAGLTDVQGARVIDGAGCLLLPGLVDMHVHLREPGFEHKEDIASGFAAAAAGGFTHVAAMPNTRPVNDSKLVTSMMLSRAREVGGVTLHPIGAITVGQKGEELTEMAALRQAGAVAVSDDGRCVMSAAVMRRALEYARVHDLLVIQHAEDHTLTDGAQMHEGVVSTRLGLRGWPRVAEDVIVARDLLLTEATRGRYHVAHASTEGSARLLREAKARGLSVSAEVTPHHLLLTDAALLGYDTACKVNPPLREQHDIDALWAALADGTIDAVATDHAPHSQAEKEGEFTEAPPGMIGLEICLPLLAERARAGKITMARLVDALSAAPARLLGVAAPRLIEGAPADLVLFDPRARQVIDRAMLRSKSQNTPFLGRVVEGKVLLTICGNKVAHDATAKETRA